MLKMIGLILPILTLVALPLANLAAKPRGPSKTITVEGWGDIQGENVAAAREDAIQDAQKNAVQMTAGVYIKSMMSDESYSKIQDDQEKFDQEVVSKVYSQSEGFVRGYKILEEKGEGKLLKVKLAVEVNDVELSRQLSILAKRMAGARFPKLMFVVQEEYTGRDGKTSVVDEPTLQSLLENALLAKGFDLVARDHIAKLRSQEAEVFSDILTDDNKAAKFAMEYGAEYLVRAVGRIKHTSFDDLGQQEHHGFAELSLSAINASSAAIVASNKESGNSPANAFSETELRVKAVEHIAPAMVDNLIQRILESWDRKTQNGIRYSVKLYNVRSYRKHGRKFMKLLEKIDGVKQVKKLSYGGDRLELEVFYPLTYDVSHLEDAIITAIEDEKAFKNLDVTYSRGRELNFKM